MNPHPKKSRVEKPFHDRGGEARNFGGPDRLSHACCGRKTMLSALDLAHALEQGSETIDKIYDVISERIAAREQDIQAFTSLDLERARSAAHAVCGPLRGLPLAVKDNIETGDHPTAYGSPIHTGHQPAVDAVSVALARRAGACVIGKTVTTEFAFFSPGPTRNPHNLGHSPGGSSSGSAAGVAAGFFPLALGTQTGGSVVRPASFCGIAGFKPSFGRLPTVGVKIFSWSLDTLGVFGKGVRDVAFGAGLIAARDWRIDGTQAGAPHLGFLEPQPWAQADDEMLAAFERARDLAVRAGARVTSVSLPPIFREAFAAHQTIQDYEATRALAAERDMAPERISDVLLKTLDEGAAISSADYDAAQDTALAARRACAEVMGSVDVLVTPSAPGAAPAGLGSTGSSVFNRIWTLMGVPAVNVPGLRSQAGLPLGMQVLAPFGRDRSALLAADWLEARLAAG
jgi:Asp-tRNA(Asn)/Glu-tRNA(Gln) amidotransferase A subunit family amidase